MGAVVIDSSATSLKCARSIEDRHIIDDPGGPYHGVVMMSYGLPLVSIHEADRGWDVEYSRVPIAHMTFQGLHDEQVESLLQQVYGDGVEPSL